MVKYSKEILRVKGSNFIVGKGVMSLVIVGEIKKREEYMLMIIFRNIGILSSTTTEDGVTVVEKQV